MSTLAIALPALSRAKEKENASREYILVIETHDKSEHPYTQFIQETETLEEAKKIVRELNLAFWVKGIHRALILAKANRKGTKGKVLYYCIGANIWHGNPDRPTISVRGAKQIEESREILAKYKM
jgi:hypothetical protein